MKEITLQDMARMYKNEYEFLNKELSRLEKVVDKEDYELTPKDDMVLEIAHNLTNPPHTITNSQLAFLWGTAKRVTNRITTDLTTKKLKGKMSPNKNLRPGAFTQDTTADAPHIQEPEDIMESFYKLSGVAEVNEQSDKDYATARKIADNHDKGPVTAAAASAWAKEAGIGIDNMDVVVQIANEILGYAGLDESKKRNFSIGSLKKRAISLRKRSMDIVDKVYEMDESEGDHLNELLNDESFMRGVSGDYSRQEVEEELDEQGAGAAVAGVPGAAKPGKGYTMVGAGTGGTGPNYKGGEKSKAKWPGMREGELEEKKSPSSGTVAFHFTTSDGKPYFGEAEVTIGHDTDDARGSISVVEQIRVKSIVDQEGNPIAITDEMKSAAKQAVEEIEDIDLLVSAGGEDDDYYGDDDLDEAEQSLRNAQGLHAKAKAKAEQERNEYVLTLLNGMNPKKMSVSDVDMCNDILGIKETAITAQTYLPKEGEPRGQRSPKPGSSCINEGLNEKGVATVQKWVSEMGSRKAANKLIDYVLNKKVGLSSSDLGDTSIFANGLDTIESLLEDGSFNDAYNEAKEVVKEMLEDEGFGGDAQYNEGVMKTLATRKLYKGKGSPEEEDPIKQFQRKDVWIPKERKSDIIAKFKNKVQTMLKEMELEGVGVETETEPAVKPDTKPGKTDKPINPLRPTPGITPKPKAEESANPDVKLFLRNRQNKE